MPTNDNKSKAQAVRDYLAEHRRAKPQEVVEALSQHDIQVTTKYVSTVKSRGKTRKRKAAKRPKAKKARTKTSGQRAKYPRHTLERDTRVSAGQA